MVIWTLLPDSLRHWDGQERRENVIVHRRDAKDALPHVPLQRGRKGEE